MIDPTKSEDGGEVESMPNVPAKLKGAHDAATRAQKRVAEVLDKLVEGRVEAARGVLSEAQKALVSVRNELKGGD